MTSIHSSMLLCFRSSSGGTIIKSSSTALGVRLDNFLLIVAMSGPNIASARSTSFSTTGQFLILFDLKIVLKFFVLGAPIM